MYAENVLRRIIFDNCDLRRDETGLWRVKVRSSPRSLRFCVRHESMPQIMCNLAYAQIKQLFYSKEFTLVTGPDLPLFATGVEVLLPDGEGMFVANTDLEWSCNDPRFHAGVCPVCHRGALNAVPEGLIGSITACCGYPLEPLDPEMYRSFEDARRRQEG